MRLFDLDYRIVEHYALGTTTEAQKGAFIGLFDLNIKRINQRIRCNYFQVLTWHFD